MPFPKSVPAVADCSHTSNPRNRIISSPGPRPAAQRRLPMLARLAPVALALGAAPLHAQPVQPAERPSAPGTTAPGAAPPASSTPSSSPHGLGDVFVTGNPLGSGLFEFSQPASVLSGQALNARRASTLGETLADEPGVTSTGFGPNASRPVIRGLDGDRIRLMNNGSASIDASSLSFDHATTIEPLVAERIEVVRGPAALLYGGNAIGGVVNVIDYRIPTTPTQGIGGRAELRAGGADRENAGVAVVDAGNGRFALHADAYKRNTDDLRIPGFARSARQRAIDAQTDPDREQPERRLPNTFSRSEGGALGGAFTWKDGYAGLSVGSFRSVYGTPAEDDVKIDMRKDTIDLAGEARALPSFIEMVKFRLNHSDYRHEEQDKTLGTVNTTFKNRGLEGRIEAVHAPLGPLRGSFGVQHGRSDFSALGDEAYVPRALSRSSALFIYEELAAGPWKFNAGARAERAKVDSDGDDSTPGLDRFGPPVSRSFSARSLSAGGTYALDSRTLIALTAASTQRVPTYYELFANGPHAATGSWEVGNPAFDVERSTSIDLSLRRRVADNQYSIGVYQTRFSNYLALAPTGRLRGEDGSFEDPANPGTTTTGEAAELPEFAYRQVPALFPGIEAQARWRVLDGGHKLDIETRADYVRATDRSTDAPLPRIAPLRLGLSLIHQTGPWYTRADLTRAQAQNRVAPNELPTDGYTMLNLYLSHRLKTGGPVVWELFARGTNLLNGEARNHVSVLKDIAPMAGRGLLVGVRGTF